MSLYGDKLKKAILTLAVNKKALQYLRKLFFKKAVSFCSEARYENGRYVKGFLANQLILELNIHELSIMQSSFTL